MPIAVVFSVYGTSFLIAALLLYFFQERSWYWHLLAVLVSFTIGVVRLPEQWQGPSTDLAVGAVFFLLFVWGIAGPIVHAFRVHRLHHHA